MFGHLKPEEFLSLIESEESEDSEEVAALPAQRQNHLEQCAQCTATWKSMEGARADFASFNTSVPEPDWEDFRSSVRTQLLARSVKRASVVRRWTGWHIRPATAWALSLFLAVGITTGGFLWHRETSQSAVSANLPDRAPVTEPDGEAGLIEAEISIWSQTGIFEQLGEMETAEREYLREMLQSAEQTVPQQQ